MSNLKTSAQASDLVGTKHRNSLVGYINRHPQLKPKMQLPSGDYLWTQAEIDAVRARKASHKSGRPSKK